MKDKFCEHCGEKTEKPNEAAYESDAQPENIPVVASDKEMWVWDKARRCPVDNPNYRYVQYPGVWTKNRFGWHRRGIF